MAKYECINCAYKGEEKTDGDKCIVCGDWIKGFKPEEVKLSLEERAALDREEFLNKPEDIDSKGDPISDVENKDEKRKELASKAKEKISKAKKK